MTGLGMFLEFRDEKKSGDLVVTTPVAYPSGYMYLDFLNGQRVRVFDDDENVSYQYDSVGYVGGTMITVLADSGLGKSTYVQQAAVNIVRPYPDAFVIHEDIENAGYANRIHNISNESTRWLKNHYRIYQDGHSETVVSRLIAHAVTKLNNLKVFSYDTGLHDLYGDKITAIVPTVVIIDSLAVMRTKDTSFIDGGAIDTKGKPKDMINDYEKVLDNNMGGARNAKFNSEMFKQILPWCKKANIILFVINHINRKIDVGFVKSARDLIGLGESESISGGRASIYLANNVLRFKNKATLKIDKDYGLNGHVIASEFYKSRTNASQVQVELVFDKKNGFDPILSIVHMLMQGPNVKKAKGSGAYCLSGLEDVIFTKKNVRDVYANTPEFGERLYQLALDDCKKYTDGLYLDAVEAAKDANLDDVSYSDNIISMIMNE